MANDLLAQIRSELDERLTELRPLLSEYEQLLTAADALLHTDTAVASNAAATATTSAPTPLPRQRRRTATPKATKRPAAPSPASVTSDGESKRAPRGAARQAILAALEHGSHTVGELATVTAMSTSNITGNLRRLLQEGMTKKTKREHKVAYVLASVAADTAA